MEAAGLPMLNCLVQQTLKALCSSSSSSSHPSKWVYAVFWRILPRNFPPPRWEYGGGALDLIKGSKRNWILVWEDGYCDFDECDRLADKERFGAHLFFKMSHEVYNYGEGLVGKVAADNTHRWIFSSSSKEDPTCFSSWKVTIDPQPKAWETQFKAGIQTIALIPLGEGMLQLGSLHKVREDPKLVASTQKKFSYLLSIPGISAIPRPTSMTFFNFEPTYPYSIEEANESRLLINDTHQPFGSKRLYSQGLIETPIKNSTWSPFPSWSCNYGPFPYGTTTLPYGLVESPNVKVEAEVGEEDISCCLNPNGGLENKAAKRSRFSTLKERNIVY